MINLTRTEWFCDMDRMVLRHGSNGFAPRMEWFLQHGSNGIGFHRNIEGLFSVTCSKRMHILPLAYVVVPLFGLDC